MTDRLDRIEQMFESLTAKWIEEREVRLVFRKNLEILYHIDDACFLALAYLALT